LSDKNVDKNVRAPQATRHHGAAALKYAGPGIWKLEVGVWSLVFGIWCSLCYSRNLTGLSSRWRKSL